MLLDMTTAHIPKRRVDTTAPTGRTDVPSSLKILYAYTIVGSGLGGVWMLLAPASFAAALAMPAQDPLVLGINAAVYVAFGVVATVGLRSPLAFAPIFLLQLAYKSLWLALVFLPRLARGSVPAYGWFTAAVFVSYVVLDCIAIPFSRLFGVDRARHE
jgi:hypothetical protein